MGRKRKKRNEKPHPMKRAKKENNLQQLEELRQNVITMALLEYIHSNEGKEITEQEIYLFSGLVAVTIDSLLPNSQVSIFWRQPSFHGHRRETFSSMFLHNFIEEEVQDDYHTNNVLVDSSFRLKCWETCESLVCKLLRTIGEDGLFSTNPQLEGSLVAGVKTGNANECDFSVDVLLDDINAISLSQDPFTFYFEDDIDSHTTNNEQFVKDGKRFFLESQTRAMIHIQRPRRIKSGFRSLCLGEKDGQRFQHCCVRKNGWTGGKWLLPYNILLMFYSRIKECLNSDCFRQENDRCKVRLNKGVKGPAVTLTIQGRGFADTTIDITPKITLPSSILSLADFGWPRKQTKKWLDDGRISHVLKQQLYLVPKGDKYWKISFANCENALFGMLDNQRTWRKGCLRYMKKQVSIWKSKSVTGLRGISSYHLKTTLLWQCEDLPSDDFWTEEHIAVRYITFLMELWNRLAKGYMGEYFNPKVNLLEGKNPDELGEFKKFIQTHIIITLLFHALSVMTCKQIST